MASAEPGTSTKPTGPTHGGLARSRAGRRVIVAALALLVLAGATSLLGPRTQTHRANAGGHELTVTAPATTRSGLSHTLEITVRRAGGFDGPVTLAVDPAYLDLFDQHGITPQPSTQTASPQRVLWEVDPPPGDTLMVVLDARIAPGRYRGAPGFVTVTEGDIDVVRVDFRTRLIP